MMTALSSGPFPRSSGEPPAYFVVPRSVWGTSQVHIFLHYFFFLFRAAENSRSDMCHGRGFIQDCQSGLEKRLTNFWPRCRGVFTRQTSALLIRSNQITCN